MMKLKPTKMPKKSTKVTNKEQIKKVFYRLKSKRTKLKRVKRKKVIALRRNRSRKI